jgi:gliding motility-associated-like protein
MKKNLLLFVLLFAIKGFSQIAITNPPPPISGAALNQWVNTNLITNPCLVRPTGATRVSGLPAHESLGAFTNTNPAFPFQSGIVLSTGKVAYFTQANDPNAKSSFSDAAWVGDTDLEVALANGGVTRPGGQNVRSRNATVLEFDFTAATSTLSIDYIFASEEYGSFQCSSKDGFAILIRPASGGAYENLAVLPSTNTAVSVATIRNEAYNGNGTCSSVNPQYFGMFSGGIRTPENPPSPLNLDGQTVVLNASKVLVPGTTYHLKIVIADDGDADPSSSSGVDGENDSAVFLPASGFNLGQRVLGNDLSINNGNALCAGQTYTIDSGLDANLYELSWTRNGQAFAGDVASIQVTQSGTYVLRIVDPVTGCIDTQDIAVDFAPAVVPGTPRNLYACSDPSGNNVFDLSQNTPLIRQGLNPATVITYHATQQDAEQNRLPLATNYTTTGNAAVTVFARVQSYNSSCFAVVSFQLLTIPTVTATSPATFSVCERIAGSGTTEFNLTQLRPAILGTQPAANFTVSFFTTQDNANTNTAAITSAGTYQSGNATLFARVQSNLNTACFATTSFNIAVVPLPAVGPVPEDQNVCSDYPLPALTNGGAYYSQSGGQGPLPANYIVTSTQRIYVYAAAPNLATCATEESFLVTIVSPANVPSDVSACGSYTLPALPSGQQYRTAANGGGSLIATGTVITQTQTIFFFVPAAAGCTANTSFDVTITTANIPADAVNGVVNVCTPYVLPAIVGGGTYYTAINGPTGTGTAIAVGTPISTIQDIFIFNASPDNSCFAQNNFRVNYVNTTLAPVAPVTECDSYILPPLAVGGYFSAPNGVGPIAAGTAITSTQPIYVYASLPGNASCTQQANFTVTINQSPAVPAISDGIYCLSYELPNLGGGVTYFTNANATGTEYLPGQFITETATLFATTPPDALGCRGKRAFRVTIIETTLDAGDDQNVCDSYVLPALETGDYYTQQGGQGSEIPAGTTITTTQTIYVYVTNGTCTAEDSFEVNIFPSPVITSIADVVACTSYTLPAPPAGGQYFTATGGPTGTGTQLANNAVITTSQTIFLYVATNGTGTTPNCTAEDSFNVTIITNGIAPALPPQCGSYTLPALAVGGYFTSPNGVGPVAVGTVITTTTTLYVYVPTAGANCTANETFVVTITPYHEVADVADRTECNSYLLPAAPANENYYLASGGAAAGQTALAANFEITQTTTVYIHNDDATCPNEESFLVTITQVRTSPVADVTVCDNTGYPLPQITTGNYYTATGGPNGSGQLLAPGTVIDTAQRIYVYAEIPGSVPLCFDENSFEVILIPAPVIVSPEAVDSNGVAQGFSCGDYTLPVLTGPGSYYTLPGGSGNQLAAGTVLTDSQTIYIYAQATTGTVTCDDQVEFRITVNPQAPDDVLACDEYRLPALLPGQSYYDGPGGNTGSANVIPAGTVIRTTRDIYYFIQDAASCTNNTFFTVTINTTPVLAPVEDVSVCDVYYLPALTVGSYYNGPGATGGIIDPALPITSPAGVPFTEKLVYVYAETSSSPNCSSETSFTVRVTPLPLINSFSNVEVCDQYTLPQLTTGGNYFTGRNGSGDALSAGDVINAVGFTTIYIYAPSLNPEKPECFNESGFTVRVVSANADTILPEGEDDITVCDSYALPVNGISGNPIDQENNNYFQQYYQLPGGPNTPGQAQIAAGTVITQNTTVYIFQRLRGRNVCEQEIAIPIIVHPTPQVADVADETVCFTYTLPALPALVNGPITDTTLSYAYYTLPGGPAGGGEIADVTVPFEATGNSVRTETFYLYAETGENQCFTEDSFTVTINSVEVEEVDDLFACETYVLPTLLVGEYFTAPNRGGTQLFAGAVLTTSQTIYINAQTATTPVCTSESDFVVTMVQRPVAVTPAAVVSCALDDNGSYGEFDLTAALAEALGTQPDVVATVFETMEDAQFNVRPIADVTRYRNVVAATQTLYIRLSSTLVECFTIVPVQLRVNPRPVAQDLEPLEVCDNGADDTDLIGVFNLTLVEADVLGAGQNPLQFDVAYFETRAAAEAVNGTQIASPAAYTTVSTTVFIKVVNIATGCFDITELELIVNPMPYANPAPVALQLCDENAPGDEREEFDLTTAIADITGGANGVAVTFYHTFNGAEDQIATDQITNPEAYVNDPSAPGVESIFVRVTDVETGCFRITLLDIRVEALPTLTVPTAADLTVCDSDGSGFGNFDLDALVADMIGGGTGLEVRFYTTLVGAENDLANARINNTAEFLNTNPFTQTIYVRAIDTRTGCFSIVYELDLIVNQAPPALEEELEPLRECDDDLNEQDGRYEFDLTEQTLIILADPGISATAGVDITYHASEQDAINGTPVIVTPERYIGFNGQVIWVRIQSDNLECFSVTSFELLVDTPVDVAVPTMLVLCDSALPNDGRTEFNLTDKDEEILGETGQGQDNIVTYYANVADLTSNTPITTPEAYTNVVNPQTLQVKVTTIFGCESFTTLTIKVNPLPTPNVAPDALELCDDNNPGDLVEIFDLTDAATDIRDNGNYILRYYPSLADADADTNELTLAQAQAYESATGAVGVRVEIAATQPGEPTCFQTVELQLIVNPLPFVGPLDVYGICQTNFTGLAVFDLDNYRYQILGAGVNLADYTVRYYRFNPLTNPPGISNPSLSYTYRNVNREETIWVYAQNNETECENVAELILSVEPQTFAFPLPNDVLTVCDLDANNDGVTEIDLTRANVSIIGTQAPASNYTITFYLTQADALAGTNPIQNPESYLTASTLPGAPIWAEIRNNQYTYGCPAYISFGVVIEELPEPVIVSVNGNSTSCVDFNDPSIVYSEVVLFSGIQSGAGHTYQWFKDGVAIPDATGDTYNAVDTGTYTVIVTGPGTNFCESLPSAGFDVIMSGPASLIGDGYVVGNAFADNQTITVLVEGFGDYQFSLNENGPWQNSNVFTNVSIGYHTIYIRDITDPNPDARCGVVTIENVSTIDYPKFFTPNNDGYNDYWNIVGLANFPSSEIFIFDRYGKLIKQLSPASNTDLGQGWDGTFNGAPLPADDYWFTVTFPDGNTVREFKSHFALKR